VGQDSSHNGLVTFSGVVRLLTYTIFDGEYNGSRRFKVTGELQAYSTQYVKITYVYSGSMNFNYATTGHYEVSHCSTYQPLNADHWISFNDTPALTWGANSIHDNYVELAHDTDGSGYGTDGLQNLTSADIYNNTFEVSVCRS
jgi:hypothetical protein